MPKNVTQYDLLISCPGDIADEINLINNAVDKFNQQFSDVLNISIRPRHWSKNSFWAHVEQRHPKYQTHKNLELILSGELHPWRC